jgi:hypothetical protein
MRLFGKKTAVLAFALAASGCASTLTCKMPDGTTVFSGTGHDFTHGSGENRPTLVHTAQKDIKLPPAARCAFTN